MRDTATCSRCGDRIGWNGQKWTTAEGPARACLPGLGSDHRPADEEA